jgi:transposase
MANRLKMAKVNAVLRLHSQGWSHRRIAAHLGIHRETVSRYLAGFSADTDVAGDESENSKPAKAPTGGPLPEPATSAPRVGDSKPAKAPLGSERAEETSAAAAEGGSRSGCARYREKIEAKLEAGLSAQRIFQDLREESNFTGSYYSVRRYVRKLGQRRSLPFRRLEQPPGEEAQVDFGSGAPVLSAEGRKKRTHVFRVVLSHSRKAYSEVVYRQTTEAFLSCLENAFREFNGVPKTLVIDNLRAAVKQADWFDPELNRRLEAFCEHYGVVILPTRPRMPRHKGKVERGVDYVQENALKGRVFESLQAENAFLSQWESSTADTRLHGTTRQQVGKLFREVEQPALQKLPAEPFPFFQEQERKVHRDGHVEVDKAYYSVPPEYVSRQVWVRWDSRLVRIFNHRWEQIAVHPKQEPGRFSTQEAHLADEKIATVERGATWLLQRAARIGPHAQAWGMAVIQHRGVQGIRVLQGLLSLGEKHTASALESACEIACSYGAYRLKSIRRLLEHEAPRQQQLEFTEEDPIIRNIGVYGELVRERLRRELTARNDASEGG